MSKALDKTYDGIVIGAGHHGLILGAYLAKAGLDILLVERRLTYGGGLSTREVTLPGFYHNLHSINHFHISETPWFKDLGLDERVSYITPRYEFGQAHRDGSALVLGRDLEESVANIARFSKKDAQTFRDWNRKAEKITARYLPARALRRAAAAGRARGAALAYRARPRIPRRRQPPAARCRARIVRERACAAAVPVQGVAVRHLADRHAVEDLADGLGDPRLRSGERLSALPGRLVQSGARADGDLHRRRRHLPAAGAHRQDRHRERQGDRHRTRRRPHRARAAVRRLHARRAPDLRDSGRARAIAERPSSTSSTVSNTPPGACSACIWRSTKARASRRRNSIPTSTAR